MYFVKKNTRELVLANFWQTPENPLSNKITGLRGTIFWNQELSDEGIVTWLAFWVPGKPRRNQDGSLHHHRAWPAQNQQLEARLLPFWKLIHSRLGVPALSSVTWSRSSARPPGNWSSSTTSPTVSWSCRVSSSSGWTAAAAHCKCLWAECWPGWRHRRRPLGSSGSAPSTRQRPQRPTLGPAAGPPRSPLAAPGSGLSWLAPGHPRAGPAGCPRGPAAPQGSAAGSQGPSGGPGCGRSRAEPHCNKAGRHLHSCNTGGGDAPIRPIINQRRPPGRDGVMPECQKRKERKLRFSSTKL